MIASSTVCCFKPFHVAVGPPKGGQVVHGLRAAHHHQQQQLKSENSYGNTKHVVVADRVDYGATQFWKDQEDGGLGSVNLVAHLALIRVVGFLLQELV
jgi:hypothetical protein